MDYSVDEAVVDIRASRSGHWLGSDATGTAASAAVCYGPVLCRRLDEAAREFFAGRSAPSIEEAWRAVSAVGSETERRANMYARLLIIVMGAAAESS